MQKHTSQKGNMRGITRFNLNSLLLLKTIHSIQENVHQQSNQTSLELNAAINEE